MPCGIAGSANWNRIRLDRQFWVIPREQIILIYDILFLATWTLTFKKYNLPFNGYNHFEIGWNFSRGRNNISCRNNICFSSFSSFLKRRSTNRVQSFGQRSLWNWVVSRVFSRDRVEKCSQVCYDFLRFEIWNSFAKGTIVTLSGELSLSLARQRAKHYSAHKRGLPATEYREIV